MGTVACGACKGSGRFYDRKSGKSFDCRACGGSGVNRNLWSTRCERCHAEIIHKAGTPTPRFCKNCRDIQLEKQCAQTGCTNTIRYKVGWDNVPTCCKRCESKRREGWTPSLCPGTGIFGCGKLIWSPPGKKFNLCPDCSAKKKTEDAAKWRTKGCKECGKEIRYHVDWDRIPDLCPDCRQKAKKAKEERHAKMRKKPCARSGCTNTVVYSIDWEYPPSLCKSCNAKRKAFQSQYPNFRGPFDTSDTSYIMPGMGQTIGQLGGARGRYYLRQGKVHCIVFEGMHGDDMHLSWDIDPLTGEIIGEVYMHHNDPRGAR